MNNITPIFCSLSISSAEDVFEIEHQASFKPWKLSSIKEELTNPSARCYGARLDGALVAYSIFRLTLDIAHLMNIAVSPKNQNCGIGKQLLLNNLAELKTLSISTVQLEVRMSNLKARRVYEKLGFYETGERQNYYQDNGENAILYDLQLDYMN